jgi:hypothetical protein
MKIDLKLIVWRLLQCAMMFGNNLYLKKIDMSLFVLRCMAFTTKFVMKQYRADKQCFTEVTSACVSYAVKSAPSIILPSAKSVCYL